MAACSAVYPVPNAFASAPRSSSSCPTALRAAVGGQHQRAHAVGRRIVGIRPGIQEGARRFRVAGPGGEQQRGAAALLHVVVELFAAGALRWSSFTTVCE